MGSVPGTVLTRTNLKTLAPPSLPPEELDAAEAAVALVPLDSPEDPVITVPPSSPADFLAFLRKPAVVLTYCINDTCKYDTSAEHAQCTVFIQCPG